MAIARVQLPDGRIARLEVPDGTTPDQVSAFVQQQIDGQPKAAAEPEQKYDPAEGMSGFDKARAGFGKAFVDLGTGVKQLGAGAMDYLAPRQQNLSGLITGQQPQSRVDQMRAEVAKDRALDAPLMQGGAAKAGNFAGNVAAALPASFLPGANTVAGAGVIGAGMGLLQPSTSTGETVLNTALGGAGGAAGQRLGEAIGGLLSTPNNTLTAAQRGARQTAQRLGLELTPGEASGSRTLQRVEASLQSNPVTSGPFDALAQRRQTRLNTIAANAVGENADELSAPVLGRAFDRVGQVFDRVASPHPVRLDQNAMTGRLVQIIDDHAGQYNGNNELATNALFRQLDGFLGNGTATQAQLVRLSSNLGKAARNNMTSANGDRTLGIALNDVRDVVDDALEGSLAPDARAAFNEARGQYRTLMQLTARNNIVNPSNGNVSGRNLASLLQQKDRPGFLRGRNQSDLYEAARVSQAFPRIVNDSGTATRNLGLLDYLASIPGGLATRAYMSAPVRHAAMIGTPIVGATRQALGDATGLLGMPAGYAGGLLGTDLLQQ